VVGSSATNAYALPYFARVSLLICPSPCLLLAGLRFPPLEYFYDEKDFSPLAPPPPLRSPRFFFILNYLSSLEVIVAALAENSVFPSVLFLVPPSPPLSPALRLSYDDDRASLTAWLSFHLGKTPLSVGKGFFAMPVL